MDAVVTTPEMLTARGRARLARAREIVARLQSTVAPFTRANVLEPLNELDVELVNASTDAGLLSEVHPDVLVRSAAEALDRETSQLRTEIMQDRAIYDALDGIDPALLDSVAARVRSLMLMDMRRTGAALADEERVRVRDLREELLKLEQEFNRNIRDDVRSIKVTDEELRGLPRDWIDAHPADAEGRRTITTDYPDAIPFMSYSESDTARKALSFANLSRATPRNLEVLRGMLGAREKLAQLLGYGTWADYATEDKMMGSARGVQDFIDRAYDATRQSGAAEIGQILEAKRVREPGARVINQWEHAYWVEKIKATQLGFDPRSVRPYFEYTRVRDAILDLAGRLFSLTFTKVEQADIWHPSVDTYQVTVDGARMGRISLDMHPREGKYKHAACFTWRMGVGGRQEPHSVLVCNFPDPRTQAGPALMDHTEVVTFFHEFGHLVHNIVRGPIAWVRVSSVSEYDFIEAPSQFLEEWIYDAEVLRSFARHVETDAPIPVETVERLRDARDFGRGIFVQRQLFLAAVSLWLHDRPADGLDTTAIVFEAARKYSPTKLLDGTHFEAGFGHLEGYTAVYATYLWSLVIAKDLLSTFAGHLMDLEQMRRYRDLILAAGGTKPANDLVEDFLSRPFSFEAFAGWLRPH